jgi:hypothetical protein
MKQIHQLEPMLSAEITESEVIFVWPLRKKKVSLQSITGYYAYPFLEGKSLLIIAYHKGGKVSHLNIMMDNMAAPPFLQDFQTHAPAAANLLHHNKKDAFQLLGKSDPAQQAFWGVVILSTVIIVAIHFPVLWHGLFDNTLTQTTIEEIYAGKIPDSNYLSLTANLGKIGLVVREYENMGRTRTEKGYYPLLPSDWKEGQPIKAVLLVDHNFLSLIAEKKGTRTDYTGIIRNILWEGLPSGRASQLEQLIKSPLENPIIIDYQANPHSELYEALLRMAILQGIVIALGLSLVAWGKRRMW